MPPQYSCPRAPSETPNNQNSPKQSPRQVESEYTQLRNHVEFANQFNQSIMGIINGDLQRHLRGLARALDQIHRLVDVYIAESQQFEQKSQQQPCPGLQPQPPSLPPSCSQSFPRQHTESYPTSSSFLSSPVQSPPRSPTSPLILLSGAENGDNDSWVLSEAVRTVHSIAVLAPKLRDLSAQFGKVLVPQFLNRVSDDCVKVIEFNAVAPKEEKPVASSPRDRLPSAQFLRQANSIPPSPSHAQQAGSTPHDRELATDLAMRYAMRKESAAMRHTIEKWHRTTELVVSRLLGHCGRLCGDLATAFDDVGYDVRPSPKRLNSNIPARNASGPKGADGYSVTPPVAAATIGNLPNSSTPVPFLPMSDSVATTCSSSVMAFSNGSSASSLSPGSGLGSGDFIPPTATDVENFATNHLLLLNGQC